MPQLNLELSPWLSAKLDEESELRGWTPEQYASMILEVFLRMGLNAASRGVPQYLTATREEWLAELDRWAGGAREDADLPTISTESLRRENMYEDRGL